MDFSKVLVLPGLRVAVTSNLIALGFRPDSTESSQTVKRWCFFQVKYSYFDKSCFSEVETHHCCSTARITAV